MRQYGGWLAAILVGVGYALLSHMAASTSTPGRLHALVALAPLIALAFGLVWKSSMRVVLIAATLCACVLLYGVSNWLVAHYNLLFLLQHAGMYALLAVTFGKTLRRGATPMISQFAGMVHPAMSPALCRYTRSATWAWTAYFSLVATLSLLLFWLAPVEIWSAFANLLGMPLLGLMFAGEYAARCLILPPEDRAGPLEAIRAYRMASSRSAKESP